MAMVTTLFFMWGFLTALNDILVPHLRSIFDLNYTRVMFINSAFFGSYFVFAIPAGMLIEKIGYKKTMVVGLLIMAVGALLFVPAANVPSFDLFLAALVVLALTLGAVVFLKNSRFGLALQAVREDAVSASMAGVNVVRMRVIAWLVSALVAGLAGGVYAWYVSVFYPDNVFSGEFSIFAIVFALFGGVASICGPIVGVILLYGIYNLIGFTTPQYFQLIYGLLIMGLVLFLPAGLVSLATRRGWHVP
jgi:ABC-type branched-subunit amino acid transport system permease subunit